MVDCHFGPSSFPLTCRSLSRATPGDGIWANSVDVIYLPPPPLPLTSIDSDAAFAPRMVLGQKILSTLPRYLVCLVVELHGPRSKFYSCDDNFQWVRVLELSKLNPCGFHYLL